MPTKGRNASPSKSASKPAQSRRGFTSVAAPAESAAAGTSKKNPGLFKEMAATAGAVAVGSAVGHTVGNAVSGMMSGGSSKEAQEQHVEPSGPCMAEIQHFAQCAFRENDMSCCEELLAALRNCKQRQGQ